MSNFQLDSDVPADTREAFGHEHADDLFDQLFDSHSCDGLRNPLEAYQRVH